MRYGRFNDWLALRMAAWFATMEAFYAFTALALLPLFWPQSLDVVQFVSSGVLQLIALPLLAVSGVIIGRSAEARAEQDHRAIMELLHAHRAQMAALHAHHKGLHAKFDAVISAPPGSPIMPQRKP